MQTTDRPTLVFDVNETLLDLTTLEPVFARAFGDAAMMRVWFSELILYSQTMTFAGHYRPFGELGMAVFTMLATVKGIAVHKDDTAALGHALTHMPPHGDVEAGLTRLRAAGFRLVTLTNSPLGAESALFRAGLDCFFDGNFSVAEVAAFKPAPAVYEHLATSLNLAPAQLCMIACHIWDTIGAQACGYRGAFLHRTGNAPLPIADIPQPDIIARDMTNLTDQLIALWG